MAGDKQNGPTPKLEDAKLRRQLLANIRKGWSYAVACEACGICYATFRNFIKANDWFELEVRQARAAKIGKLTDIVFEHAKNDETGKTALKLLAILDPAFREKEKPSKHQHVHGHVHVGIEQQRTDFIALATKLGVGHLFVSPAGGSAALPPASNGNDARLSNGSDDERDDGIDAGGQSAEVLPAQPEPPPEGVSGAE